MLSLTGHPQLVPPLPSELLSSAHKCLFPAVMLNIGCQLDRIYKITGDKAPGISGRQLSDLVGMGLPTLGVGGSVPWTGVLG